LGSEKLKVVGELLTVTLLEAEVAVVPLQDIEYGGVSRVVSGKDVFEAIVYSTTLF
jgi:hypothetical protein